MEFTASIGVRIALLDKPDLTVKDVVATAHTDTVDTWPAAQEEASLALLHIHEELDDVLDDETMRLVGSGMVHLLASFRHRPAIARDAQLLHTDQNDTHEMTANVYLSAVGRD